MPEGLGTAVRKPPRYGWARSRQMPASATAPMHENTISFIQAKRKSEPIPMEWMTAIGHMA